MSAFEILQIVVFGALLVLLTRPLGAYMARVFAGERTPLDPVLRPIEKRIYSLCGVDPRYEMRWTRYTINMLLFNLCGIVIVYGILRLQHLHPWNPADAPDMSADLAFNTAVSFVSNTNWQSYVPETAPATSRRWPAFTWQNFVSAGTGIALAIALIRGLTRRSGDEIGNFWVDLTRACLWVLLPISIILAVFFMASGVIQNLAPPAVATTLEGAKQTIAHGAGGVAGGDQAARHERRRLLQRELRASLREPDAAHQLRAGARHLRDTGRPDLHLWPLRGQSAAGVGPLRRDGRPLRHRVGSDNRQRAERQPEHRGGRSVSQAATSTQSGGSMEGKEVRFGAAGSALFTNVTTDASCGAVNNSHDSLTPLGGGMAMLNIAMGEIIFGGVGTGLMGMLIFALLAVFIAGLMVGRTPEYLGKKIESKEMKMIMLAILVLEASILGFSALAATADAGP